MFIKHGNIHALLNVENLRARFAVFPRTTSGWLKRYHHAIRWNGTIFALLHNVGNFLIHCNIRGIISRFNVFVVVFCPNVGLKCFPLKVGWQGIGCARTYRCADHFLPTAEYIVVTICFKVASCSRRHIKRIGTSRCSSSSSVHIRRKRFVIAFGLSRFTTRHNALCRLRLKRIFLVVGCNILWIIFAQFALQKCAWHNRIEERHLFLYAIPFSTSFNLNEYLVLARRRVIKRRNNMTRFIKEAIRSQFARQRIFFIFVLIGILDKTLRGFACCKHRIAWQHITMRHRYRVNHHKMLGIRTVFSVMPIKGKAVYRLKSLIRNGCWRVDIVYLVFVKNNNIGKRIKRFCFSATVPIGHKTRQASILIGGIVYLVVTRRRFCLGVGAHKGVFRLFEVCNKYCFVVERLRISR